MVSTLLRCFFSRMDSGHVWKKKFRQILRQVLLFFFDKVRKEFIREVCIRLNTVLCFGKQTICIPLSKDVEIQQ